MPQRENFYLLLNLDPSVDDWASIETRIKAKQRAWALDRTQGSPKKRRLAERYLPLLGDIENVLRDPETRFQESQEARKLQQKQRREKLRDLDEAVGLIKASGTACDKKQFTTLVNRFKGVLSEKEIRKRLAAAGVSVREAGADPKKTRPVKERIDPVTAKNIRRNLDPLSLETLYHFLDLNPRSSPQALRDRAEEIYKENQRIGKTDADATAQNELTGICKDLFKDNDGKTKYDNYLAIEAMEGLKSNLEIAGSDRFLSLQELDALVQQACQRGVSAQDARDYIEEYAQRRKWGIQPDADLPSEELQLCGFCSALAPPAASKCSQCGESLKIECPRCAASNPTQNPACESCGCRIGDAPLVKSFLKESERLALRGSLNEALICIDKALLYWPDWKPATEARDRIRSRQEERESEISALEELVQKRKLIQARTRLDQFERRLGQAGAENLRRRVGDGLKKAESAFKSARQRKRDGDSEGALDRCDEALAACSDFQPALAMIAASPPPPPAQLLVKTTAAGFRLSWETPSTGRSVSYRILRKKEGSVRNDKDGEVVGEVRDTSLDDPSAPVGRAHHYAVYTVRSGVPSHQAAQSGPHLLAAAVENLQATAGDREVILSWKSPPGCRCVRAWRQIGKIPSRPGDGTELSASNSGVHDTGLVNGRRYGYLVVAVFRDPIRPGRDVTVDGQGIMATAVAPPSAVRDLRYSRTGKVALLSWTPVENATVQIRQANQLPEYAPGLILPASETERFGKLVPNASSNGVQVTLEGRQGRIHFVPLSVSAGTAVVGRAVQVTMLDPVTDLRSRRTGQGIALTWKWPAGLDEVRVCYSYQGSPRDPVKDSSRHALVTRKEYERTGCWELRHAERRRHYFSVFAKATGSDLYSEGARVLESLGREVSVSYQVSLRKSLLRRSVEEAWLELNCGNGDLTTLPELLVVGKAQRVPLSPIDGEVLVRIPSLAFENGRATIPIPPKCWGSRPFVKLFFKDAAHAREVRLLPASQQRLRVG